MEVSSRRLEFKRQIEHNWFKRNLIQARKSQETQSKQAIDKANHPLKMK